MKTNNKLVYTIFFSVVFFMVAGLSYAYFKVVVGGNDVSKPITVTTTKLLLSFTDGKEIKASSIEPGWSMSKSVVIENTGDDDAYYTLGWQSLKNGIINDELVIKGTCTSTNNTCEDISETPVPNTITNGTINTLTAASGEVINPYKEKILIKAHDTHTYEITLEFKYLDVSQNYNQGKSFNGVFGVSGL